MMLRNNFQTSHAGTQARRRRWLSTRKTFLFLLCLSVSLWPANGFPDFTLSFRAQAAPVQNPADRAELHQALLDLTNLWTVMCVAAHPDDEDGATLTVLRRKYGVHTVTLFSTYGEGGQNAIGPELYEELGAIRARETLKAADIQGSQAHFLALRDFGFSKSAEEAFRIWNREEALSRMVLKIRKLRPDVIITNHDTTSGHGHHQATGRLVEEAFDAAADASRFPEQLIGLSVWQPQRLFVRVNYESGTGSKQLEEAAASAGKTITINPNEIDTVRGSTYAEQALQALQQHASQGPWPQTIPKEGAPTIRYRLARQSKSAAALPPSARTFFDGLRFDKTYAMPTTLPTIDGRPLTELSSERERVLEALIAARKSKIFSVPSTEKGASRYFLLNPRLTQALVEASGVKASLTSQSPVLVPGTKTTFSLTVSNQGEKEIHIRGGMFTWPGAGIDGTSKINLRGHLSPQKSMSTTFEVETPTTARVTVPHAAHLYDDTLFGEAYSVGLMFDIVGEGVILPLSAFTRVDVAPAVEIASIAPSPYIFTPANLNQPLSFKVRLINHQDKPFKGAFGIASPTGHINEAGPEIALAANETREFTVRTNVIPVDTPDERRTPRADFGPIIFSVHPPESANVITQRETRVIYSDARVTQNLRVGYVRSFDETLHNALDALGVEARELTMEDIRAGDLQKLDTIIIDNRGYQAHPELVAANARLLEYVKNGGTLIVFYHKANEWNPDPSKNRPQLAPYSITLGNERVTDETAPVAFNEPQHALLTFPNKIGTDDFKGWVQERGLYYPRTWDERYQALLATSDASEASLRGGLLTANYGSGHYIYTSMVWYRQLRAGIPGAYRMFANMISYGNGER